MIKSKENNTIVWLFIAIVGLAVLGAFFLARVTDVKVIPINNEGVTDFSKGWQVTGGDGGKINLPASVPAQKLEVVSIHKNLPEVMVEGMTICFKTVGQGVRVLVDGSELYTYISEEDYSKVPDFGQLQHFVRMPRGSEGKVLEIQVVAESDQLAGQLFPIVYGSKNASVFYMLGQNAYDIVFLIILVGISIIILLVALMFKARGISSNGLAYLGLFTGVMAFWVITDSCIPQFGSINAWGLYLASYTSFMLMAVPMLLFVKQNYGMRRRVYYNAAAYIVMVNYIVFITLNCLGIKNFFATITPTHIILIGVIFLMVINAVEEWVRYKNKDAYVFIFSTVGLGATAIIDIARYYMYPQNGGTRYLLVGVVIFVSIFCGATMIKAVRIFEKRVENVAYERLAYTDVMTGLGNRTAFERDLTQAESLGSAAVVVVDLNDLKETNDTYGHAEGDVLISACGNCIKEAFGNGGKVYRIGGDEYAVLMGNSSKDLVEEHIEQFWKSVFKYNLNASHSLSAAIGFALEVDTAEGGIKALVHSADMNMYKNKRKAKSVKTKKE